MKTPLNNLEAKEIRLRARPTGPVKEQDFEIATTRVPEPQSGQILVRNSWMSLDPSARLRMKDEESSYLPRFEINAPLEGWAVGEVISSRSSDYVVGDQVWHGLGWREYATLNIELTQGVQHSVSKIKVSSTRPPEAYLGALGWVGLTAYVGLLHVAQLKENDVVFISGAGGAVGSLAVQIAKLRGHTVIASAGTQAKCNFVSEVLGADYAFCYRERDSLEALQEAAPEGIDVYFDNVGGSQLEAALESLRIGGRVALCGAISSYNDNIPVGPSNLFNAIAKDLTLRGFLTRRFAHLLPEFQNQMSEWLSAGTVVYPQTVVDGISAVPEAFVGLMSGLNQGKMLANLRKEA